jgi:hypothetical protein
MLKVANDSSLLLGKFADDTSQITAFVFLFTGTYVKGRSGSLCTCPAIHYLQHIPKQISFQLSTFNCDDFFKVQLVT